MNYQPTIEQQMESNRLGEMNRKHADLVRRITAIEEKMDLILDYIKQDSETANVTVEEKVKITKK